MIGFILAPCCKVTECKEGRERKMVERLGGGLGLNYPLLPPLRGRLNEVLVEVVRKRFEVATIFIDDPVESKLACIEGATGLDSCDGGKRIKQGQRDVVRRRQGESARLTGQA